MKAQVTVNIECGDTVCKLSDKQKCEYFRIDDLSRFVTLNVPRYYAWCDLFHQRLGTYFDNNDFQPFDRLPICMEQAKPLIEKIK